MFITLEVDLCPYCNETLSKFACAPELVKGETNRFVQRATCNTCEKDIKIHWAVIPTHITTNKKNLSVCSTHVGIAMGYDDDERGNIDDVDLPNGMTWDYK